MKKVANGDYVKVHYTGRLDDGEIFDSSQGSQPIEVQIGGNQVIPGFENALVGMGLNEKKTFTIEASDAYGDRDDGLRQSFDKSDFPEGFNPEIGQVIILQSQDQEQFPATVMGIEANSVTLDLNHPLAGKALTFDIEVVHIGDKPTESQCGCGCSCS